MHEENILELARKVLQADKVITEQHLGLEYILIIIIYYLFIKMGSTERPGG
jgi:hypothetical protein